MPHFSGGHYFRSYHTYLFSFHRIEEEAGFEQSRLVAVGYFRHFAAGLLVSRHADKPPLISTLIRCG